MNLTAAQIKSFNEISADKKANKETLNVALMFHSNKTNELDKASRDVWMELADIHNLDMDIIWKLETVDGSLSIVKKDD